MDHAGARRDAHAGRLAGPEVEAQGQAGAVQPGRRQLAQGQVLEEPLLSARSMGIG